MHEFLLQKAKQRNCIRPFHAKAVSMRKRLLEQRCLEENAEDAWKFRARLLLRNRSNK